MGFLGSLFKIPQAKPQRVTDSRDWNFSSEITKILDYLFEYLLNDLFRLTLILSQRMIKMKNDQSNDNDSSEIQRFQT